MKKEQLISQLLQTQYEMNQGAKAIKDYAEGKPKELAETLNNCSAMMNGAAEMVNTWIEGIEENSSNEDQNSDS